MKVMASGWLCPKREFTRHNYPNCIEIAISMECLSLAAHRVIFALAILTVSLDGKLKPCRMAVSKPSSVGGTRVQRFMVFKLHVETIQRMEATLW